jgi:L-threonylcarbamoyladenylate synthase
LTDAADAIRAGLPVILPTDTVYGLCASSSSSTPAERLYELKGRDAQQPSALVAADVDMLLECVPELDEREMAIARALLPGPWTLVVSNPALRYRWITGSSPETIGVRVPVLPDAADRVLSHVGCIVATSANLPGGPDPARVEDIPEELRAQVAAIVDVGELPGTPSTVVDITQPEPRILREGAVPAATALELISAARA